MFPLWSGLLGAPVLVSGPQGSGAEELPLVVRARLFATANPLMQRDTWQPSAPFLVPGWW